MAVITLTTDFGSRDHYVGVMKGVILSANSDVRVVDITHEIGPHQIVHAAFVLRQAIQWFPTGTVHVAVVDPGVGSSRRILAGRYDDQIVIAPDNGLVTLIHRDFHLQEIYSVENAQHFRSPVSATFHGRDIMAPVAAHVAAGTALSQLGPPAGRVELLQLPQPKTLRPLGLEGSVLYVDRFGNLVTNIGTEDLAELFRHKTEFEVYVGETSVGPIRATYSDVLAHQPLALVGSSNMLEIAVNCERADRHFSVEVGGPVSLRARDC